MAVPVPDPSFPQEKPSALLLMTLGAAALVRVDGTQVLGPSKPLALLTYLQCAPGRTSTRDHLASLLWGDSPPDKAAGALRSTLHRLRGALDDPAPDSSGSEISLTVPLSTDRDCFLEAIAKGRLLDAVELYCGPFLAEYGASGTAEFEHWADIERARLESLFLQGALTLGDLALDQGCPKETARLARLMRARAPASTAGWTLLLRALIAAGDDLSARAEVEALHAWLTEQGRAPDPATTRLIAAIQSGAASATESPGDHGLIPELVGREREFTTILGAWDAVRRGAARHVHVVAPSGLGKTRLLRDITTRLKADGVHFLYLRGLPGERTVPYAFAGELARAAGAMPGAPGVSPAAAAALVDLQPALSAVFTSAHVTISEGDLLRKRTQALEELVTTVADEHPVALIIDDLHWLDDQSVSILESIAGRLGRAPILLITASRPRSAGKAVWPEATRLTLEPLTTAQIEALLASLGMFPSPNWGARIAPAVARSTGGVPLLILETLQLAREAELLHLEQRTWSCPDTAALLSALSTRGAIDTRLRTLDSTERRLLLHFALAGTSLLDQELGALPNVGAAVEPTALEALERRGYLERDGNRWDLAHDAIGEAVVRLAAADEQPAAHHALGTLFAARSLEPATVRRAAYHLRSAGDQDRLNALFRRSLISAKRQDPRLSVGRHAQQFLGVAPDPEAVRTLVRSVPAYSRLPLRRTEVALSALMLVLMALAATLKPWQRAAMPSDADLIVATGGHGSRVTLRTIPMRSADWPPGDPLDIDGVIVGTLPDGILPYLTLAPNPDGEHFAFDRIVGDSGQIDLYLWSKRDGLKRLSDSPGDDFGPSWSPDGKWLVFSTARWTPRDDTDADIAILDPATGEIRQLTVGPDYDTWPIWSPDGTRIAFSRRGAGESGTRICWITIAGGTPSCNPSAGTSDNYARGWLGNGQVAAEVHSSDTDQALSRFDLATWRGTALGPGLRIQSVDPRGRWIAFTKRDSSGVVFGIIPAASPGRFRTLSPKVDLGNQFWTGWSWKPGIHGYLQSVHIVPRSDTLPFGIRSLLDGEGLSASGGVLTLPAAVLQWSVSDSTLATISGEGVLTPERPGNLTIYLSAGGWRSDSLRVTIAPSVSALLHREPWTDTTLAHWRRFGDPLPLVVTDSGPAAFLNNGDGVFDSGAWSVNAWQSPAGFAFEATISTPIRRLKWQLLEIQIAAQPSLVNGGLSIGSDCGLEIPGGEGKEYARGYAGGMSLDSFRLPLPPQLETGSWYPILIQVFPDGTCGIAVDGRAVYRSHLHLPMDQSYHVVIQGQSVGTRMLVGPFTIWRGIREGIDWRPVDRGGVKGHP